ncbi:MAG: SEC-C domain-containing protein [Simkaniaceae bacterium]|nr:SEC-C domain-containing protein [Simkaniaceae bacterium]
MLCPCHSQKEYKECCQPYHNGTPAPSPLKLMRSRYSAYALGLVDYILSTQIEKVSPTSIKQFCAQTSFDGLEILDHGPDWVKFHATLSQQGQDVSFTEHSLFKRINNRLYYLKKT